MKKLGWLLLLLASGGLVSSCTSQSTPAANTTSTAASAIPSTKQAPSVDALLAMDKKANEAFFNGDAKFFQDFLSDKFIRDSEGAWRGKAAELDTISKSKCKMDNFALVEPQMSKIDDDNYVLIYRVSLKGTCSENGKQVFEGTADNRAATIWTRNGDKWQAVFHGENPIVDAPYEVPPPPARKKEPNSPAPVLPPKSADTVALAAVEKAGWEAWRDKDAKKLDGGLAKTVAVVSPDGSYRLDRTETVSYWSGMDCKNVKTVDVKDPYAVSLGPNTEMLAFTGIADGTCFDQKNFPMQTISVYVKEGGAWKLAFAFGSSN